MYCIWEQVEDGLVCKNPGCDRFLPNRFLPYEGIAACKPVLTGVEVPVEDAKHTPLPLLMRYGKSTAKWVVAGRPKRTDEQVEDILVICNTCKYFNSKKEYCKLCGCGVNHSKSGMFNKVRRETEHCPDTPSKW